MTEIENSTVSRIINSEIVREYFGYWPDFHDAEITKVTFEANSGYWPSVTFLIAAFGMTKGTDESGHFKLTKHCNIELQFAGVHEIEFDGFSHQNVIFDLVFEENSSNVECSFDSSTGLRATVVAEKVSVLSLTPTKR